MDPFALLKGAVENGWRLGLAMFLSGAAVPILDRFDLPRPGVLSEWSGVSTLISIAGLAVLITSIVGHAITAYSRSAATRAEARKEDASVLANIQTLNKPELTILYGALHGSQSRFEVDSGTIGDRLLRKKIFVAVGFPQRETFICEVHRVVLAERMRLLPVLREAAESANKFPSVQRHGSGWIVA